MHALEDWLERSRQRRTLREVSDHLLKDIGISRSDADREGAQAVLARLGGGPVRYRYLTCDVFTDRRFGGNQLAVLLEAQGLDTEAMQAIAAEFNYSETTFVLPPADPAHLARVRIFTPRVRDALCRAPDRGYGVGAGMARPGASRRQVCPGGKGRAGTGRH